jgi:hypothetical protein
MTVGLIPTFKMRTILGPHSGVSYSALLGGESENSIQMQYCALHIPRRTVTHTLPSPTQSIAMACDE